MEKKAFGQSLKKLRRKAGLNRAQLAGIVGVTASAVMHWENGKSWPRADYAKTMADCFGMQVDELLRGESHEADFTAAEHLLDVLSPAVRGLRAALSGTASKTKEPRS